MNETCPACGIVFEREHGYWTGAMYVAYGLAIPMLMGLTLLVWLITQAGVGKSYLLAVVLYCPLIPTVFRYSRVLWMHFDQVLDPRKPAKLEWNRS